MILPATFPMCFCILAQLWRDSQVTKGIQRMQGKANARHALRKFGLARLIGPS